MARASLDTNVMLRLMLKDVPEQHERAKTLVSGTARLVVHDVALVEYVYVLEDYYGLTRPQVADMVRGVMSIPNLECSADLVTRVLTSWLARPKLSFEDCYLAERSVTDSTTPLWTFDKKLARQHPGAREVP